MSTSFAPDERRIYTYWDGTTLPDGTRRQRHVDPMQLLRRWRAQLAQAPDLEAILKRVGFQDPAAEDFVPVAERSDDDVLDALARATPAIRATFDVKGLADDGSGLTEWEQVAQLSDFLVWLDDLKKDTGSTPNSSTPSPAGDAGAAGLPPTGPTTTANMSASG